LVVEAAVQNRYPQNEVAGQSHRWVGQLILVEVAAQIHRQEAVEEAEAGIDCCCWVEEVVVVESSCYFDASGDDATTKQETVGLLVQGQFWFR
jgi:hypothetical protein